MFLGAGSVMHGMNDDVDMRHYGALRKVMPVTFLTFAMGYLAIIGFPGFSGFWSKDKIIEVALTENWLVGVCALLGAGITGFYMTRLMLMTFFGREALGGGRPPARVAQGDDRPADRARRAVGARRPDAPRRLDRGLPGPGGGRGPRTHDPPIPALAISVLAVSWRPSASPSLVLRRQARRPARGARRTSRSSTRAARADLYGDAINDELVVKPGKALTSGLLVLDDTVVDGAFTGGAVAVGGCRHAGAARPERLRPLLRPVPARRRPPRRPRPAGGEPRMNDFPWLTVLWVVPLVGALATAFVPQGPRWPSRSPSSPRCVTLVIGIVAATQYDRDGAGMQLTETHTWIEAFGVHYALGVDGLGLLMVLLTVVLVPIVLLAAWHDSARRRVRSPASPGRWRSRPCRWWSSPRPTCSSSTSCSRRR